MTPDLPPALGRAQFHRRYQAEAVAQAELLLARREALGNGWLAWVAGELYRLSPAEYAAMVRRELERLSQAPSAG
ncbi:MULTISPECIES: hypothetical protein [Pseudomonas]|uniref:Uncharacterized protein n=1 Tax=Pseudomonas hunanensis TaxID=1247546 RepID=A0ACC6K955_9PSED|nr:MULTISPECIES: hypothetical protein [Pseudomonas]MBP2261421.1 hypothetical protein [Pseudomonas sp. BP8]MDR6714977.1 hypothetical protein [Pseudomonas hunanensis]HDS1735166.1 hypothetical protein [Pseudomonas putida]